MLATPFDSDFKLVITFNRGLVKLKVRDNFVTSDKPMISFFLQLQQQVWIRKMSKIKVILVQQ